MKKGLNLCVLLISFSLVISSCVSKKKWTELMSEKDQTLSTLAETQEQVASLEKDFDALTAEKEQLALDYKTDKASLTNKLDKFESDLGAMKMEKKEMMATIEEANAKYSAVAEKIKSEFTKFTPSGYSLNQQGQKLYVKGENQIKFRSGSARIKSESKKMLKPIAEMLMANADAFLLVEGHTDNVPMKITAPYASNKDLSLARANAVIRALVKMGVNRAQLTSIGHGEDKPLISYDEGTDLDMARSTNRRADLAIMVSPSSLYQMGNTL